MHRLTYSQNQLNRLLNLTTRDYVKLLTKHLLCILLLMLTTLMINTHNTIFS
jgi:hypothetical protein